MDALQPEEEIDYGQVARELMNPELAALNSRPVTRFLRALVDVLPQVPLRGREEMILLAAKMASIHARDLRGLLEAQQLGHALTPQEIVGSQWFRRAEQAIQRASRYTSPTSNRTAGSFVARGWRRR